MGENIVREEWREGEWKRGSWVGKRCRIDDMVLLATLRFPPHQPTVMKEHKFC